MSKHHEGLCSACKEYEDDCVSIGMVDLCLDCRVRVAKSIEDVIFYFKDEMDKDE